MKHRNKTPLLIAGAVLAEVGTMMVLLNARPHAPLGFWLWFGGIAVLVPSCALWLYRRYAHDPPGV